MKRLVTFLLPGVLLAAYVYYLGEKAIALRDLKNDLYCAALLQGCYPFDVLNNSVIVQSTARTSSSKLLASEA